MNKICKVCDTVNKEADTLCFVCSSSEFIGSPAVLSKPGEKGRKVGIVVFAVMALLSIIFVAAKSINSSRDLAESQRQSTVLAVHSSMKASESAPEPTLSPRPTAPSQPIAAKKTVMYRITAEGANIRVGPSMNEHVLCIYTLGSRLIYLDKMETDNEGRIWRFVECPNGERGWISDRIVMLVP